MRTVSDGLKKEGADVLSVSLKDGIAIVKQEFIRYVGKDVNSVPARRVTTEDVREVFDNDLRAGIIPPLRMYIYVESDKTHVAIQSAVELFSQYNGMEELAGRVDKMLDSVINSVK